MARKKGYFFEHKTKPIISFGGFIARLIRCGLLALVIVAISMLLGTAGYHHFEGMSWLDAALNASMILTGMGPVSTLQTENGKLFAIFYSLFSGVVFLSVTGLILAPVAHRMLHYFHIEDEN